ncbi:MAG: serine protein kinase RIO [Candidatus Altiarchaeota archaeon]|nr:serine protein kinase RIO [Candidatus Altiarchaeota archaeon]
MIKQTEYELRKISEGVFDRSTLMTLYDLSKKNLIRELKSIVATGKESNVYHGLLNREEIAVKIYLVETSDFKTMEKYLRGDRRFSSWKNHRHLIYNWAKKEFKNLSRLQSVVRCPKPIGVENNVLVMEFIGEDGIAAQRLKDSPPENPKRFFRKIKQYMKAMYKQGIIHGDLSEYNILNWGEPVIIDLSMGVLLDHPLAEELLRRDIRNVLNYFRKFGIEEDEEKVLDFVRKKC